MFNLEHVGDAARKLAAFNVRFSAQEIVVDLVAYRGYSIALQRQALTWRFLASPTHSDLPIFSRPVSHQFPSREAALFEAKKHIDRLLNC